MMNCCDGTKFIKTPNPIIQLSPPSVKEHWHYFKYPFYRKTAETLQNKKETHIGSQNSK